MPHDFTGSTRHPFAAANESKVNLNGSGHFARQSFSKPWETAFESTSPFLPTTQRAKPLAHPSRLHTAAQESPQVGSQEEPSRFNHRLHVDAGEPAAKPQSPARASAQAPTFSPSPRHVHTPSSRALTPQTARAPAAEQAALPPHVTAAEASLPIQHLERLVAEAQAEVAHTRAEVSAAKREAVDKHRNVTEHIIEQQQQLAARKAALRAEHAERLAQLGAIAQALRLQELKRTGSTTHVDATLASAIAAGGRQAREAGLLDVQAALVKPPSSSSPVRSAALGGSTAQGPSPFVADSIASMLRGAQGLPLGTPRSQHVDHGAATSQSPGHRGGFQEASPPPSPPSETEKTELETALDSLLQLFSDRSEAKPGGPPAFPSGGGSPPPEAVASQGPSISHHHLQRPMHDSRQAEPAATSIEASRYGIRTITASLSGGGNLPISHPPRSAQGAVAGTRTTASTIPMRRSSSPQPLYVPEGARYAVSSSIAHPLRPAAQHSHQSYAGHTAIQPVQSAETVGYSQGAGFSVDSAGSTPPELPVPPPRRLGASHSGRGGLAADSATQTREAAVHRPALRRGRSPAPAAARHGAAPHRSPMSTAEAVAAARSRVAAAAPPSPLRPEVKHHIPPTLAMSLSVYTPSHSAAPTHSDRPQYHARQAAATSAAVDPGLDHIRSRQSHSQPHDAQPRPRRRQGKGSPRRLQQDTAAHAQPMDTAAALHGASSVSRAGDGAGASGRRHVASRARMPGATGGGQMR